MRLLKPDYAEHFCANAVSRADMADNETLRGPFGDKISACPHLTCCIGPVAGETYHSWTDIHRLPSLCSGVIPAGFVTSCYRQRPNAADLRVPEASTTLGICSILLSPFDYQIGKSSALIIRSQPIDWYLKYAFDRQ